jgi:phosphatidylinositol-3-phosphatase
MLDAMRVGGRNRADLRAGKRRAARVRGIAVGAAILCMLAGCAGGRQKTAPVRAQSAQTPVARSPTPSRAARDRIPRFGHVIVIVLENKDYSSVIGAPDAPTINSLADRFALLSRYFAVAHPSLPNYLALVSGSTQGITDDCTDCTAAGRSLAATLAAAGRTWKTYAEGLPSPGFTGADAGDYAKKHDPFAYFSDVTGQPGRLARIVPLTQFRGDLAQGRLPDFSLVVPDQCHDMHDCPVSAGDTWLKGFLAGVMNDRQMRRGVVFVLFDEADNDNTMGGGHVAALAIGPTVRRGARVATVMTHYSVLRTIEDAWGLPRLGRSASAPPITGIWR